MFILTSLFLGYEGISTYNLIFPRVYKRRVVNAYLCKWVDCLYINMQKLAPLKAIHLQYFAPSTREKWDKRDEKSRFCLRRMAILLKTDGHRCGT